MISLLRWLCQSLGPYYLSLFGMFSCAVIVMLPSIWDKRILICDTITSNRLDILVLKGIHIRPQDTNSLLHPVAPVYFNLCHRLRLHCVGGGVSFLIRSGLVQHKLLHSSSYRTFKTIIISVISISTLFLLSRVYHPTCSMAFSR